MAQVFIDAPLVWGFLIAAVSALIYKFTMKSDNHFHDKLPPLINASKFKNLELYSCIDGITAAKTDLDRSRELDGVGRTSRGVLYRINMLVAPLYMVCTDYKLVRIVLEGDNSKQIPESEKTSMGRGFDLFDGIGSIFS